MRKPIIAGNWKMYKTISEAIEFANEIKHDCDTENVEVVICAPFTIIKDLKNALEGTNVKIGAQNFHYEDEGAFTGEISAKMLREVGAEYVIVGHSERRQYFNETDETVNLKVKKALSESLTPIICVGESLEQRDSGITEKIVTDQIKAAFSTVSPEEAIKTVIAYEPIWAIGTGKTATSAQANEVCLEIREELLKIYGEETSEKIRIQYGGSVKPGNIKEIMSQSDIDGALVGGASLVAEDYLKLIKF
ncbi:triose-phosphate isomerase [Proteocatella sphenisci]|uniref:triose-phosphate isomerase n=1 Tax=Proteocatella sphenisci TaxID=181070 RepID=UPI000490B570|nr:triose-phosphate isomerase [Proteocatella sphenisci]